MFPPLTTTHPADVLPSSLSSEPSLELGPSTSSLIVPLYLDRAHHFYLHVASSQPEASPLPSRTLDAFTLDPSPESELFMNSFSSLAEYVEDRSESSFGAFDLSSLQSLCVKHGQTSAQCEMGKAAIRGVLEAAVASPDLHVAVVSVPTVTASHTKRQPPQSPLPPNQPSASPQLPIGGVSTCFTSADLCNNGTDTCSGRGSCVSASKAGKTCFVCACNTTISRSGKSETWVGESCERKDISGWVFFIPL